MKQTLFKYFVIILIVVAIIAILWFGIIKRFIQPSSFTVDVNRAAVIKQIRSLARLETASYTIEKVIDAQTSETNAIQRFLFGDRLLFIAHGQVIAGFDLSQISEKDVKIRGKEIEMSLPAPQILSAALDNTQSKVYDRRQGILRRNDTEMETTARAEAEKSIRAAACEGNILEVAAGNARRQLTAFLTGFGFTSVTIVIPAGTCI